MNNVIGMDIGGTQFRVGLFDQEGRRLLVSEDETSVAGGRDWMLEEIRKRCRALLDRTDYPIKACGVSFGGPVDFARQQVTSVHSPGWNNFALSRWVEESLHLPCRVDNDANAGALGEFRFGVGRGAETIFYITVSTGIGGGLICHGKLYRGKDSLAGELGHLPVSDSGTVCSCGATGCLETFCSGTAIARRGREWATRRPEGVARMIELSGGDAENISAKAVFQAAAEGDIPAAQIISEAARWLARAILTVIRVLNPEKIVVGGGVAQAGLLLLGPLRGFLQEMSSPALSFSTEIVQAELGPYAPLYGAAALALELL